MVDVNLCSNSTFVARSLRYSGRSQQAAAGAIMTVTPAEGQHTIDVLVLAFSSDPAVRWLYPDPHQYLAYFSAFVEAFAGKAFEEATAYRTGDYAGAALWLPPGVQPDEEAILQVLENTISPEDLARALPVFEQMAEFHPREPHWYLPLIGVDPAHQGQGIGSALLRHALARCDRDHLPAYLESSNARNVPLYERHGFVVLGEIQTADSPPLYPMRREPR